jgi:hypothetical protein
VTESPATPMSPTDSGGPVFPPGRYGRRRAPARRSPLLVALVATLVGVAGLMLTVRMYQQYGPPDYHPKVVGFSDITDDGITVEFDVRKAADSSALCRVRARDELGADVGFAEVHVGPGERTRTTYRLATTGRPVTVEVIRCYAAG